MILVVSGFVMARNQWTRFPVHETFDKVSLRQGPSFTDTYNDTHLGPMKVHDTFDNIDPLRDAEWFVGRGSGLVNQSSQNFGPPGLNPFQWEIPKKPRGPY